jgi:outer membrane protein, multidrug efflux system
MRCFRFEPTSTSSTPGRVPGAQSAAGGRPKTGGLRPDRRALDARNKSGQGGNRRRGGGLTGRALGCAALAALAPLAACRTAGPRYAGPPATAAAKAPAAIGAFASASSPAFSPQIAPGDWWRLYRDPRLDALVREAFAANTDLRAAEANLQRSQALVRQARTARQPTAALTVNPSYQQLSTESYLQPGVIAPLGLIDAGVQVTYEFDLFGRLHRGVQAAAADDEAVRAARDLVKTTVAADVARAYAGVCGAGEQLAAARRSLQLQRQSGALTARLVRAGRGTALDVTRSTAQISQYQADIPALEAAQRNALYRLAVLTGRPPADYPRDLEACATAPRLLTPIPVGDGAALIRRRPDIREAERNLAAATYRIGVATADLYPRVTLGATAGTTGALLDAFTAPTNRYGVGPSLTWEANRNPARARIAEAEAESRVRLAQFDGAVLTALREAETALTTYAHDLDRHSALAAVTAEARTAVVQATTLYRGGRVGFLDLLDAERSLASAQSALAASDTQLSGDQVAIFLALGGGWGI